MKTQLYRAAASATTILLVVEALGAAMKWR